MNIHTPASLRRTARRMDRERQRRERNQQLAEEARGLMRDRGFVLHVTHRRVTRIYWLGGDHADARALSEEVAALVLEDEHVVAVDGGLFGDSPQLWRWAEG